MFFPLFALSLATLLALLLFLLGRAVGHQASSKREKNTPFECGFDPYKSARIPFSLRYFLVALIFVIFDIEIALLLPLPLLSMLSLPHIAQLFPLILLIILVIGLLHE